MSLRLMPIDSMPGREHLQRRPAPLGDLELDLAILDLPSRSSRLSARRRSSMTGREPPAPRRQQLEQAVLGRRSARTPPTPALSSRTIWNGRIDQVADDRLDVTSDVADLGELGGLDLEERRAGKAGEAAAPISVFPTRSAPP